jgi:hypothetical protein
MAKVECHHCHQMILSTFGWCVHCGACLHPTSKLTPVEGGFFFCQLCGAPSCFAGRD